MDILDAGRAMVDLTHELDSFQAVTDKLLHSPAPAADKLVNVLEEISQFYLAVDGELSRYASLTFYPADSLKAAELIANERATLAELGGGKAEARMHAGKGHCYKIGLVYDLYLKPWFATALTPKEAVRMEELFDYLQDSDNEMMDFIEELGHWLTQRAAALTNLLGDRKFYEAEQQVRADQKEMQPIRQAIAKTMGDLYRLKANFGKV